MFLFTNCSRKSIEASTDWWMWKFLSSDFFGYVLCNAVHMFVCVSLRQQSKPLRGCSILYNSTADASTNLNWASKHFARVLDIKERILPCYIRVKVIEAHIGRNSSPKPWALWACQVIQSHHSATHWRAPPPFFHCVECCNAKRKASILVIVNSEYMAVGIYSKPASIQFAAMEVGANLKP